MPSVFSPPKSLVEPSQKGLNVQLVLLPSEPGAQTKMSDLSPLSPLAEKLPCVVK